MKRHHRVTSHSIPSSSKYGGNGAIDAHVHEPPDEYDDVRRPVRGTIVAVHPWSVLGGGEHNVLGLARRIVLAAGGGRGRERGGEGGGRGRWRVVTFELESDPAWKGGPLWGMMSNHSHEVDQIVEVVNWVRETYHRLRAKSSSSSSDGDGGGGSIVLLGSSAGAAMAGTAMARLLRSSNDDVDGDGDGGKDSTISAYVAIGYTFGNLASIAFGRHFSNVVVATTPSSSLSVPRLFVMGERDEFTSVEQLERMTTRMRGGESNGGGGGVADVEIVPDVGHFELERSGYDELVARMVLDWLDRVLPA